MQDKAKNSIDSDDMIDLLELFSVLKARKRLIFTIVLLGTFMAIILVFLVMKPIYSAKSMIEIGHIDQNIPIDNTQDIKNKLSYIYKVGPKSNKATLPHLSTVKILKHSETALVLEVYAKNNNEGVKFLQSITDSVISDSNKKISSFIKNQKKSIKFFKKRIEIYQKKQRDLRASIKDMEQGVPKLTREDPALAGVYALQINGKESSILEIDNKIEGLELEIKSLEDNLSLSNIKPTEMIGEIEVLEQPIKPKKALIVTVSFISSLIFAIFLVFTLNFFQGIKKEDT